MMRVIEGGTRCGNRRLTRPPMYGIVLTIIRDCLTVGVSDMKILQNLFPRKRKPGCKLPECVAHLAMPNPKLVGYSIIQTTYLTNTPTFNRRTWLS